MSLYDDIGVARDATDVDIRQSYRRKAQHLHPDKGGKPEAFQRIQIAYETLSDPERRKQYDATGEVPKAANNIDGEARDLIMQALMKMIDTYQNPEQHNLVDEAKRAISNLRDQAGNAATDILRRAAGQVAKRRRGAERINLNGRDSQNNLLATMLSNSAMFIEQQAAAKAAVERHKFEVASKAVEILDMYSCDVASPSFIYVNLNVTGM